MRNLLRPIVVRALLLIPVLVHIRVDGAAETYKKACPQESNTVCEDVVHGDLTLDALNDQLSASQLELLDARGVNGCVSFSRNPYISELKLPQMAYIKCQKVVDELKTSIRLQITCLSKVCVKISGNKHLQLSKESIDQLNLASGGRTSIALHQVDQYGIVEIALLILLLFAMVTSLCLWIFCSIRRRSSNPMVRPFNASLLAPEEKMALNEICQEILAHSPLEWLDTLKCVELLRLDKLMWRNEPKSKAAGVEAKQQKPRKRDKRYLRAPSPPPRDLVSLETEARALRTMYASNSGDAKDEIIREYANEILSKISFFKTAENGLTMNELTAIANVSSPGNVKSEGSVLKRTSKRSPAGKNTSGRHNDSSGAVDVPQNADDDERRRIEGERKKLKKFRRQGGDPLVLVFGTREFAVDVVQSLPTSRPQPPPRMKKAALSDWNKREQRLHKQWIFPAYSYFGRENSQNFLFVTRPKVRYCGCDVDEYTYAWRLMSTASLATVASFSSLNKSPSKDSAKERVGNAEDDFPQRRWVYLRKFKSYWELELENRHKPIPLNARPMDSGVSSFMFSGPWTFNSFIDHPMLLVDVAAFALLSKAQHVTVVGKKSQQFVDALAITVVLLTRIRRRRQHPTERVDLVGCFRIAASIVPPYTFYDNRLIFDIFTAILALVPLTNDPRYKLWQEFHEVLKKKVLAHAKNEEYFDGLRDSASILESNVLPSAMEESLRNWAELTTSNPTRKTSTNPSPV